MGGPAPFSAFPGKLWGELLKERPPARAIARRPYYRWLVIGTVCIGAFMGQLDASIAQLVLPVLERDFAVHLSAISWIVVAYTLTLAVFLPIFGRLADLYGRKMLYTMGFLLFILGSGLCGVAPGLIFLVGFRVLQAIGAALLQTNSIAIVVTAAGAEHRGRALGVQAAAQAVGLSAGPALGGFLIHMLSWRWVFWINVPFGLFGALVGWFVLPQTGALAGDRRFDWQGALLLAPALFALLLLISEGHIWGAASPAFAGCATLPVLLLPLFARWERKEPAPLIDLALFRRHAFWAGNVAGLLAYALLFGMFFLMPFVFARAYHENPLIAGLRLMTIPAALGLVSPASGALYDRAGPRFGRIAGMGLCFLACVLLALTMNGSAASLSPIMAGLAILGVGVGLFTSPNNSAVMAAAPAERIGQAGGILNTMRSFGTSFGVAAATAVLAWQLGVTTGRTGDTLHAPPPALLAAAHDVLAMFALFALLAGALSAIRSRGQDGRAALPPDLTRRD
jgi:EmrB/QacA subfamily drug resistance transporter